MSKPFSSMRKDMDVMASVISTAIPKLVVHVAAKAGENIAEANPIDTGLSSGNWQGTIGTPAQTENPSFFPTSTRANMAQLRSTKKPPQVPVFVSNPVPYVRSLNMGTSSQAPIPFWVERNAEKAIIEILKKGKIIRKAI